MPRLTILGRRPKAKTKTKAKPADEAGPRFVVMVLFPNALRPVAVWVRGIPPKGRDAGVGAIGRAIRQARPGQSFLRAGKDPELGWRFREAHSGGAFVYGWVAR